MVDALVRYSDKFLSNYSSNNRHCIRRIDRNWHRNRKPKSSTDSPFGFHLFSNCGRDRIIRRDWSGTSLFHPSVSQFFHIHQDRKQIWSISNLWNNHLPDITIYSDYGWQYPAFTDHWCYIALCVIWWFFFDRFIYLGIYNYCRK